MAGGTYTLLLSGSAVQVGWSRSHTDITGNELADAAAKLAAEGTAQQPASRGRAPTSAQIGKQLPRNGRSGTNRETTSLPPSAKLLAISSLLAMQPHVSSR